jgi:hypothetical protein
MIAIASASTIWTIQIRRNTKKVKQYAEELKSALALVKGLQADLIAKLDKLR